MSIGSKSKTPTELRAIVRAAQSRTISGGGEAAEFLLLPPARGRLEKISDIMTLLTGAGVTARSARAVAEQLALGRVAYVSAPSISNSRQFRAKFAEKRVAVHELKPRDVDVKALRESLGYSQSEFAHLLGFTTDSVQNWEQPGRPKPQGPALTILRMAARDFSATVRLIAESQAA